MKAGEMVTAGERYFQYTRVMAGHEECNFSRWVWVTGGDRVFLDDWSCPRCGLLLGTANGVGRNVNVPEGCMFISGDVAQ